MIFATNKKIPAKSYLADNPISIIATNIPSVMGGRHNIWKKSGNAVGLKDPYGKPYTSKTMPKYVK